MNSLYTFGCSFTAEYFPVGYLNMPSKYDEYKEWRKGSLPDVWPKLLASKLNYNCENKAVGGSSNYEIFRQFINVLEHIKQNDILIFGWTSILRYNVANFCDNNFNNILPNTNIPVNCLRLSQQTLEEMTYNRSHSVWLTEIHGYIKLINILIKSLGAHVFHWTSDDHIFNNESDFVNEKNFILPKSIDGSNVLFDMMGYLATLCAIETNNGELNAKIIEETKGLVEDCHFGEHGHKYQAEYFYKHIKNNI